MSAGRIDMLSQFVKRFFLTMLFLVAVAVGMSLLGIPAKKAVESSQPEKESIQKKIERVGEKIVYDVKLGSVRLGQAMYQHLPPEEVDGKPLNVVRFETHVVQFNDVETIYSDPETHLPLKVKREINNVLGGEHIIETYDQKNYALTIKKKKWWRESTVKIEKDSPIQHPILLSHYVRDLDGLDIGWSMKTNFPTKEFVIRLIALEEVTVPAGVFKSYHFKGSPVPFDLWVSADEERIPVKIEGSGMFGYSLEMRKREFNDKKEEADA